MFPILWRRLLLWSFLISAQARQLDKPVDSPSMLTSAGMGNVNVGQLPCQDEFDDCAAEVSSCEAVPWMRSVCRRSCDSCHPRAQSEVFNLLKSSVQTEDVPNVVFEVGEPRTGTTFQFQMLCAAMALKKGLSVKGHCFYADNLDPETLDLEAVLRGDEFWVVKSHKEIKKVNKMFSELKETRTVAWVFTTGGYGVTPGGHLGEWAFEEGGRLGEWASDLESSGGHGVASEYATLFGLSAKQTSAFHDYLKWYDILRICCGTQMSQHWRYFLQRGELDASHPLPCEDYPNISVVENNIMATDVWHFNAEGLKTLSINDGDLNGTYCESTQRRIAGDKLDFNYNFRTEDH